MTQTIRSDSASSAPTRRYRTNIGEATEATSQNRCQIFAFEDFQTRDEAPPDRFSTIGALIAEWEQDPQGRAELEAGRRWVADQFYGEDGETLRTLRLARGWSQARLAELIATSQPHIARIERGTENLTIETCRKIAGALGIDLNRLDEALRRQEALFRESQR